MSANGVTHRAQPRAQSRTRRRRSATWTSSLASLRTPSSLAGAPLSPKPNLNSLDPASAAAPKPESHERCARRGAGARSLQRTVDISRSLHICAASPARRPPPQLPEAPQGQVWQPGARLHARGGAAGQELPRLYRYQPLHLKVRARQRQPPGLRHQRLEQVRAPRQRRGPCAGSARARACAPRCEERRTCDARTAPPLCAHRTRAALGGSIAPAPANPRTLHPAVTARRSGPSPSPAGCASFLTASTSE